MSAHLDLRANSIGDGGARVLARGLAKNRSLVQLNLRGNLIGNAGASCFAEVLDVAGALEILDLDDNFIDDAFSRKLGNGAAFYGKRQSSFYGENDQMKKKKGEKNWEFNGPKGGGYYVLDEEGRPVSRRRGTPLWDKNGGRK